MFRANLDRAMHLESTKASLNAMHGKVVADQVWSAAAKISTETPWSFERALEAIVGELIVSCVVVTDWDDLRRLAVQRDAAAALGATK